MGLVPVVRTRCLMPWFVAHEITEVNYPPVVLENEQMM